MSLIPLLLMLLLMAVVFNMVRPFRPMPRNTSIIVLVVLIVLIFASGGVALHF